MTSDQPTAADTLRKIFERADQIDPLAWIGPPLDPNLVTRRRASITRAQDELGTEIMIGVR